MWKNYMLSKFVILENAIQAISDEKISVSCIVPPNGPATQRSNSDMMALFLVVSLVVRTLPRTIAIVRLGHSGDASAESLEKALMIKIQPNDIVLRVPLGDMRLQCCR